VPLAEAENYVPILEFNYKFSALSAKYEIEKNSKFNFYAEVLAVCGAFVTSITLLNSLLGGCFAEAVGN
jgi:hypothetical protein